MRILKTLIGICLSGFLVLSAEQGSELKLSRALIRFSTHQNWADSLELLGVDILVDLQKEIMVRSIVKTKEKMLIKESLQMETVGESRHRIKKLFAYIIPHSEGKLLFRGINGLIFYGWKYVLSGENWAKFEGNFYSFGEEKKTVAMGETGYKLFFNLKDGFCACSEKEPERLYLLDRQLRLKRILETGRKMFVRKVFELENGDLLVFHYVFSSGYHFSHFNSLGKFLKNYLPAFQENSDLRAYFFDNFLQADYYQGKIYFSRVYPRKDLIELFVYELETGEVSSYRLPVEDFKGQPAEYWKRSSLDYAGQQVCAVNGLFVEGDRIYLGLTISKRSDCNFKNYLYLIEKEKRRVEILPVEYGSVIYYDRADKNFVALQKDHQKDLLELTVLRIGN